MFGHRHSYKKTHPHEHDHRHPTHVHTHGAIDPSVFTKEVRHQLLHHVPYLSSATIHIDPANASGEEHHRVVEHVHDNLPAHSH
jgi:hypothetical protein